MVQRLLSGDPPQVVFSRKPRPSDVRVKEQFAYGAESDDKADAASRQPLPESVSTSFESEQLNLRK